MGHLLHLHAPPKPPLPFAIPEVFLSENDLALQMNDGSKGAAHDAHAPASPVASREASDTNSETTDNSSPTASATGHERDDRHVDSSTANEDSAPPTFSTSPSFSESVETDGGDTPGQGADAPLPTFVATGADSSRDGPAADENDGTNAAPSPPVAAVGDGDGDNPRQGANPPFLTSIETEAGGNTFPAPGHMDKDEGSSSSSSTGGGSSSSDLRDETNSPSKTPAHPKASLKVGERLEGDLFSKRWRSAVSVSRTDGSVLLSTLVGEAPRDADGRKVGPTPRKTAMLAQSDPAKVEKVRQTRRDIIEHENAAKEDSRAKSNKSGKKGVVAVLKRLMPFGKGGWLRRRARKHAKAHLGEVFMTVTNRGVVVSTIGRPL